MTTTMTWYAFLSAQSHIYEVKTVDAVHENGFSMCSHLSKIIPQMKVFLFTLILIHRATNVMGWGNFEIRNYVYLF